MELRRKERFPQTNLPLLHEGPSVRGADCSDWGLAVPADGGCLLSALQTKCDLITTTSLQRSKRPVHNHPSHVTPMSVLLQQSLVELDRIRFRRLRAAVAEPLVPIRLSNIPEIESA